MVIKNHLKSIISTAIAATALVSGSLNAEIITGSVYWLTVNANGYTLVNIQRTNGQHEKHGKHGKHGQHWETGRHVVAYYTGTNSAIATVIDNAKRLNQTVTVSIDNKTYKILYVQ